MLGHYFHRIILIYSATPCEQCCARDYIHHGSTTSGTKRGATVPLGIGTRLRHALAALTYIGTLYTIRVRMTVVYVELKPFALQCGLRLLYVASYAWLSEDYDMNKTGPNSRPRSSLPRTPA